MGFSGQAARADAAKSAAASAMRRFIIRDMVLSSSSALGLLEASGAKILRPSEHLGGLHAREVLGGVADLAQDLLRMLAAERGRPGDGGGRAREGHGLA